MSVDNDMPASVLSNAGGGLPKVGEPDEYGGYELPPIDTNLDDGVDPNAPVVTPRDQEDGKSPRVEVEPSADGGAAADELPSHLVVQARVFGLDPKEFATAAHLEGAIAAQQKFLAKFQEKKADEPPATLAPKAPEAPPAADDFKLDPEEWDPKTVELFGNLNAHWAKKFAALEAQVLPRVEQLDRTHRQEMTNRAISQFDDTIAALGEDWEPVFGKGAREDLTQTSPAFQARSQVYDRAMKLAQTGVPWKTAIQQVVYGTFPEHLKAVAQQELKASAKNRQGKFTRPPTRREAGPEDPEQKALANLTRRMREMEAASN